MATSTVASVASLAYLLIGLASVLSVASADKATTSTTQDLPGFLDQYAMQVALASESGPVEFTYKVVPLTAEAGLNQTNENTLKVSNSPSRLFPQGS